MKKTLSVFLSFSLIFCLLGCAKNADYIFLYDTSEVITIDLITVTGEVWDEEHDTVIDYTYDVLITLTSVDQFLADFEYMMCFTINALPSLGLYEDEYAVKLNYSSGQSELICAYGQAYFSDGTYTIPESCFYFDEEEFNALIEVYLSYENKSQI